MHVNVCTQASVCMYVWLCESSCSVISVCMCIYACMYACTLAQSRSRSHTCPVHMCIFLHTHLCVYKYGSAKSLLDINILYASACMYACACICTYVCAFITKEDVKFTHIYVTHICDEWSRDICDEWSRDICDEWSRDICDEWSRDICDEWSREMHYMHVTCVGLRRSRSACVYKSQRIYIQCIYTSHMHTVHIHKSHAYSAYIQVTCIQCIHTSHTHTLHVHSHVPTPVFGVLDLIRKNLLRRHVIFTLTEEPLCEAFQLVGGQLMVFFDQIIYIDLICVCLRAYVCLCWNKNTVVWRM
jgi:hypothetical protein